MVARPAAPAPRLPWDAVGPVAVAAVGTLLATTSGIGFPAAVALALVGAGASFLLHARFGAVLGAPLASLPALLALAGLVLTSPAGPLSDAAAALGGLALLVLLGRSGAPAPLRRGVARGLVVPALGVGVALGTALLFPPGERAIGIATLLLFVAVVAVGTVLLRSGSPESEG